MQQAINRLLEIMQQLRDPERGCPWDLEQSYRTIVPHTLEEAYEVADAIERNALEELKGELGDLLFQVVFYAQIATEEGRFTFEEVVESINAKLVRRHPHVFGELEVENSTVQTQLWEQLKQQERGNKEGMDSSALDGVLDALPALTRAAKIQRRAAHVGFDWPEIGGVLDKVEEEFAELRQAKELKERRIEEEMGDLLFSMVNLCRHLGFDSEGVLRRATTKFENRFRQMERRIAEEGYSLQGMDSQQMEQFWQKIKEQKR
ncbi:MAG: nucleoside triphosphate pyrophosphohydrolase [Gammaproteobacteria bacterium]|jgi:ATP diphosphatase|nr:nucleoside triphosphate pyrophosphohydrolase [Gammaproteobacteria bacterium]MBT3488617.1 nucleoside triphosphate pyrophosphohydrolase [Gammaproteobacteria bacterium]MBT3717733.1 nucleoside triphosphate pyrophosphohydrolase [Gammaproteobacteria bacterium]MBT3844107.1 nucleoside triphosphate pyrophosphohydrolase [Gammaproteobacteria bacterium]MBT3893839.1 nucleoside triphosphate pyrophosphohydrolase [Gammaproteobacteria bacterium]